MLEARTHHSARSRFPRVASPLFHGGLRTLWHPRWNHARIGNLCGVVQDFSRESPLWGTYAERCSPFGVATGRLAFRNVGKTPGGDFPQEGRGLLRRLWGVARLRTSSPGWHHGAVFLHCSAQVFLAGFAGDSRRYCVPRGSLGLHAVLKHRGGLWDLCLNPRQKGSSDAVSEGRLRPNLFPWGRFEQQGGSIRLPWHELRACFPCT